MHTYSAIVYKILWKNLIDKITTGYFFPKLIDLKWVFITN